MAKYKVGIVGYGWVSTAHIAAINATADAEVVAVCSSRPLAARELCVRHGGEIEVYPDLAAMLRRRDLDVVSICSYPSRHAADFLAAAKAGKHVIVEKPVSLNWEDAKAMSDAARVAGIGTCVCFEVRFSAQMRATRALLDAGLLGSVHYGEVDYFHGIGPWYGQYRWNTSRANGGSSLLSAGCHAADALLHCMGGEVAAVTSFSTASARPEFAAYEYPTTSVTIVRFRDGRVGKVASVIDCLQPYYFHTHLVGSEGSLLDNRFHSARLAGLDRHAWSQLSFRPVDSGDVADHPYRAQFEAFFAALRLGETMPHTGLEEALRSHRLVLAADRSAALGREVRIEEIA